MRESVTISIIPAIPEHVASIHSENTFEELTVHQDVIQRSRLSHSVLVMQGTMRKTKMLKAVVCFDVLVSFGSDAQKGVHSIQPICTLQVPSFLQEIPERKVDRF